MKWISVKDKLPKGNWSKFINHLSEEVIIANSCAVTIGWHNRNDGLWYVGEGPLECQWIDKITHWMPLPKNPHGKD